MYVLFGPSNNSTVSVYPPHVHVYINVCMCTDMDTHMCLFAMRSEANSLSFSRHYPPLTYLLISLRFCVYLCMSHLRKWEEYVGLFGAGMICGFELPNMSTENWTQILWKRCKHSCLQSQLSSPYYPHFLETRSLTGPQLAYYAKLAGSECQDLLVSTSSVLGLQE